MEKYYHALDKLLDTKTLNYDTIYGKSFNKYISTNKCNFAITQNLKISYCLIPITKDKKIIMGKRRRSYAVEKLLIKTNEKITLYKDKIKKIREIKKILELCYPEEIKIMKLLINETPNEIILKKYKILIPGNLELLIKIINNCKQKYISIIKYIIEYNINININNYIYVFPGGKKEKHENNVIQIITRELNEEFNINESYIKYIDDKTCLLRKDIDNLDNKKYRSLIFKSYLNLYSFECMRLFKPNNEIFEITCVHMT